MQEKLIFDLGFHNGDDTDFYLFKGFDVIAIEANYDLVVNGLNRFKKYIDSGKLIIINKAISETEGRLNFYIHPDKSDWSSCYIHLAESDGTKSKVISVEAVTFDSLCREFGTPLYAKVDIEGCDQIVAKQLYSLKEKPKYVSFETSKRDYAGIFSWLYVSGYNNFQLVNQLKNPERESAKSGSNAESDCSYRFSKYSSGFFGDDLPKSGWLSFDDALTRYIKYKELKIIDNQELALGWIDLHAKL